MILFEAQHGCVPSDYDEQVLKKVWKEDTPGLVGEIRVLLESSEDFSRDALESLIKDFADARGIGLGKVLNPLRLLLVGTNSGPGMFDMISVLGKEETLARLDRGLQTLAKV